MNPTELQRILDGAEFAEATGLAGRLRQAIEGLDSGSAGPGDLVALVRQALETWALRERDGDRLEATVQVPTAPPWPTRDQWRRASMDADDLRNGTWRIKCRPWRPDWLQEGDALAVEQAVLAPERRAVQTVSADPLVANLLHFDRFQSAGQREAVRSAFLTPAGSTILTVLPTGAGKSLVFQFVALHRWERHGLVLVIVPTVALARDQERRFLELVERSGRSLPPGQRLAYHGGLAPEERETIRRAVREGRQPIIFAAPESVVGSLRTALLHAAEQGSVSYYAVDEAHIITQWADFRPQFQALAGLRDAMQKRCPEGHPFRTLLLTATLTEEGFETLQTLFGTQGFYTVADIALRNEPSYILTHPSEQQQTRVIEALSHLPRPLIVYTTKPDDAKSLCDLLKWEGGFKRVESVVGGDMSTQRGEQILNKWTSSQLDVIVATSAFGLGVDQSDVRAILHACIPESMDRWYQEVGRSGRDGKASASLVIPSPQDKSMAYNLAHPTLIGSDRGWSRWMAMHANRRMLDEECLVHRLPLNALVAGYDLSAQWNRLWNLRTLTAMARAKMIKFSCAPFSKVNPGGEEEDWSPSDPDPCMDIEILDADSTQDPEAFDIRFQETRDRELARDDQDFKRMVALVSQQRTVHELLRETYQVSAAGIRIPNSPGDCTTSRRLGRSSNLAVPGFLVSQDPGPCLKLIGPLLNLFEEIGRGRNHLVVTYNPELLRGWQAQATWTRLLHKLAQFGMVEFFWPATGYGALNWQELADQSPCHYVYAADRGDPESLDHWDVPRVSLLRHSSKEDLGRFLLVPHRRHLLIVPEGLRHPLLPSHDFDYYAGCDLPFLIRRLEQP